MAIEKYTIEAFILDMYESREDDIIIKAYTKDFGLIFIKANSLRKSVKLRGHIQKERFLILTIVEGREYYKLTGVQEVLHENQFVKVICKCLNRFIQGGGKNIILFDRVKEYFFLKKDFNVQYLKLALYLDVLILLGYIDIEKIFKNKQEYLQKKVEDIYIEANLKKKDFVENIQKAIKDSML